MQGLHPPTASACAERCRSVRGRFVPMQSVRVLPVRRLPTPTVGASGVTKRFASCREVRRAVDLLYWRQWSRCEGGALVCPRVQPA